MFYYATFLRVRILIVILLVTIQTHMLSNGSCSKSQDRWAHTEERSVLQVYSKLWSLCLDLSSGKSRKLPPMIFLCNRNHTDAINSHKKHTKFFRGKLFKSVLSDAKCRYCWSGMFAQPFEFEFANLLEFAQYPTVIPEPFYIDPSSYPK